MNYLAGCLLFFLLGVSAYASEAFSIACEDRSLIRMVISAEDELSPTHLVYEWATARRADAVIVPSDKTRQPPQLFDRHQAVVRLTVEEIRQFRQWITESGILELLNGKYPNIESSIMAGLGGHSSLAIVLDGKKHALEWTGDTVVPPALYVAIENLNSYCKTIASEAQKQARATW